MGFLPFVRILIRNQRSHKAASFGSMMGVLISIAFITGSFMTSDAIVSDLFQDQLEEVEYHYTAFNWHWWGEREELDSDGTSFMDDVRSIDGVEDAGLYREMNYGLSYMSENTAQDGDITIWGLDSGGASKIFDGDVNLSEDGDGVVISNLMSQTLGLSIGDEFNVTVPHYFERYVDENGSVTVGPDHQGKGGIYITGGFYEYVEIPINFTVNVTGIYDDPGLYDLSGQLYPATYNIYMGAGGVDIFHRRVIDTIDFWGDISSRILIRIDPDHFTNLDDVPGTRKEASELRREIQDVIEDEGYSIEEDRMGGIYEDYLYWSITMRVFLVIMSFPLFLLCFYLILVGSRIGMENKVQEIALLKVKGASKAQIFWMLFLESLIHGTLGTLFGVVIGSMLSVIFIRTYLEKSLGLFSLLPGPLMVITLLLISCTIISLIRLRSMLKLSRMDILQAVRGSPERKEKRYRPTLDVVVIIVISLLIGIMMFFNENRPEGLFQLALYSVTEVVKPLLVLFLPFLLILTVSRFLVLGIPQTISLVSRPFKALNRELHPLLVSGLRYRNRRVAIMAILISITISFGILVLSQMETRQRGIEASLDSSVPSDLYVVASGANPSMETNLSLIDGVEDVVSVSHYSASFHQSDNDWGQWSWGRMVGFDVPKYQEEVSPSRDLLIDGEWIGSLSGSSDLPSVIINKITASETGIVVGDTINITLNQQYQFVDVNYDKEDIWFELHIEGRVVGVVDHLPGMRSRTPSEIMDEQRWGEGQYNFLSDLYEEPAVYISIENVPRERGPETWSYLIDVKGDNDGVKENITRSNWTNGLPVVVDREEELAKIKDIPANKGMDLMLIIQFSCVLITVIVGLFLIQLVQNTARRREFAEVMSRGATRDNIFRLLLSEGLVVLIVGLVIGTATGFLVGYSFQTVFTGDWASSLGDFGSTIDVENRITIDNGVAFPPTIIFIHLLTLGTVILSTLIVSSLTSRIDVASNLRMRRS